MLTLQYFLFSPGMLIITALLFCGVIGALIGKKKNQPVLVSFALGGMLGPIGWLLIWNNKHSELREIEREKIYRVFKGENPKNIFTVEEIKAISRLLAHYIMVIKIARASFPLILACAFLLLFQKHLPDLIIMDLLGLFLIPIFFIVSCLAGNALAKIESYTAETKAAIPSFYYGSENRAGLVTLIMSFVYSKKAVAEAQLLLDKFKTVST